MHDPGPDRRPGPKRVFGWAALAILAVGLGAWSRWESLQPSASANASNPVPNAQPDQGPSGQRAKAGQPAKQERKPLPALPPLVGIGPRPPEEWTVLVPRPGPSSDTLSWKEPTAGVELVDTIVQASTRTALICYQGKGPFESFSIRNCILRVEPETLPLDRSYWGIRGYDMVDTLFDRVEITGFGRITPKHDEGHAIYLNVRGSLTIENSYIHHNGGQGLQLVNRPRESVLPAGPAEGSITIRNTSFRENAFNPDRGAFQVSIFGTGQDIEFEDVSILAGYERDLYPRGETNGGLLIEPERFDPRKPGRVWWRKKDDAETDSTPYAQGRVELTRIRVHHWKPSRPLVQIKGCEELLVRSSSFEGGRIELDQPNKPGPLSGRIVWQGNRGSAPVYVRGEHIGRADQDFVIE